MSHRKMQIRHFMDVKKYKPRFKLCISSCGQASPIPIINWLKDGLPVAKNVTVSNTDTSSQLMIFSAERQDTGIYTIIVKNIVGQETSSVEIRITGTHLYPSDKSEICS